jgi:hypothetical protein
MIKYLLKDSIYEDGFTTFETTWLGEEYIDLKLNQVLIPILNLTVDNDSVVEYLGAKKGDLIYLQNSFFLFEKVKYVRKNLAIHSRERGHFINNINTSFEFNQYLENSKDYELGSMGVFFDYTYDGVFYINASNCYLVFPEIENHTREFISIGNYDPFKNIWLNEFKNIADKFIGEMRTYKTL